MVVINYNSREVSCKIVYYGPGLSGKTTNLIYVHGKVPGTTRGDLISLATDADRTLYFDFLPINIGDINGFTTKFQLYTVPGQVFYNATRKLVLRGVDGLIFVADSQRDKADENVESLNNLKENLEEYGIDLKDIPLAMQYNKRDLPDVMSIDELDKLLNTGNWKTFEACANKGTGVFDTLKYVIKLVLDKAKKSPQAMRTSEMGRVEDAELNAQTEIVEQGSVADEKTALPAQQPAQPNPTPAQSAPEEKPAPKPEPAGPQPQPSEQKPTQAPEPQKSNLAASSETPPHGTEQNKTPQPDESSQEMGYARADEPTETHPPKSTREEPRHQVDTGVAVAEDDEDPIARAARELEESASKPKPEPKQSDSAESDDDEKLEYGDMSDDEEQTEIIHNDQSMGMFDKSPASSDPASAQSDEVPEPAADEQPMPQPPEMEKPNEERELYERLPEIAEAEEKMCTSETEKKAEEKPADKAEDDDDSAFRVPTMQKSLKVKKQKKKGFFLFRWLFGKR